MRAARWPPWLPRGARVAGEDDEGDSPGEDPRTCATLQLCGVLLSWRSTDASWTWHCLRSCRSDVREFVQNRVDEGFRLG